MLDYYDEYELIKIKDRILDNLIQYQKPTPDQYQFGKVSDNVLLYL